jgi:hypothetical protein
LQRSTLGLAGLLDRVQTTFPDWSSIRGSPSSFECALTSSSVASALNASRYANAALRDESGQPLYLGGICCHLELAFRRSPRLERLVYADTGSGLPPGPR